jgi:hypothetical protein
MDLALSLDTQDRPVEAAQAYETAINESSGGLEAHLNVAVIYFLCADPGYAARHRLSREFIAQSASRFYEVIAQAQEHFPRDGEGKFWRLYYDFVHLGANEFVEEAAAIVRDTGAIVPFFYLFTRPGGERYRDQALQLYTRASQGNTTKDRYIVSVLSKRF